MEIDVKDKLINDLRARVDKVCTSSKSVSDTPSPRDSRSMISAKPPIYSRDSAICAFTYSPVHSDSLDSLVAETFNSTACKFPMIRINRGFYRIRATEVEIAQVNGKLLARADAWNNGKFGVLRKFLSHFEYVCISLLF